MKCVYVINNTTIATRTHCSLDNVPSIVGGFVVKNDPRGLQKQPRDNVPLAWPSPIHPFRGHQLSQSRRPIRSSNESAPSTYVRISVSAKDGHYHEVASLHVRIITKKSFELKKRTRGGTKMEGGATRVWGLESQVSGPHRVM